MYNFLRYSCVFFVDFSQSPRKIIHKFREISTGDDTFPSSQLAMEPQKNWLVVSNIGLVWGNDG